MACALMVDKITQAARAVKRKRFMKTPWVVEKQTQFNGWSFHFCDSSRPPTTFKFIKISW
jgi:hypothetical protein